MSIMDCQGTHRRCFRSRREDANNSAMLDFSSGRRDMENILENGLKQVGTLTGQVRLVQSELRC